MKNKYNIIEGFKLIPLFLLSCNQTNNSSHYSSVEIYCICITSGFHPEDGFSIQSPCAFEMPILPRQFIAPGILYYSTKDSGVINSLERLFFNSPHISDTLIGGTDTRFLVLMKKGDRIADTLVYDHYKGGTFNFNEKYKFKYNFFVMDSIRKIIKKDTIDCLETWW